MGAAHTEETAVPFVVGDIDPASDFVHVIDVAGLRAVLTELDTVTDFAEYLDSREAFIRGKQNNTADSEWSMLARFMLSYDDQGEPIAMDAQAPGSTWLTREEWDNDQFKQDLLFRRQANIDSRVWDALVERHTQMTEGRSFSFTTSTTVEANERVVRHMALENRLDRRILGKRWLEACQIAEMEQAANIRTIPRSAKNGTTYVFLTVRRFSGESEDVYIEKRRALLTEMMLASLVDVPDSLVVIGLASELGASPETYDQAFLDVIEHDGVKLRQDAQTAWENKRKIFQSPVMSQGDEWSIPRPRTPSRVPAARRYDLGQVLGSPKRIVRKLRRNR
jgi:hypothetical protein